MSWHYSQELGAESSAGSYAVSLVSELLKSKNTHGKYSSKDNEMDSCQSSQSGMMSAHSAATTKNAQNLLINCEQSGPALSSRVASLVKIYLQLVRVKGLKKVLDQDCGQNLPVSLTKYDPQESLWKTHQCLLLGGLESFSETWPKWGIMQSGECWGLSMSEHLTSVRGSGYLLPTPDASERGPCKVFNPSAKSQSGRTLQTLAACDPRGQMWPTIARKEALKNFPTPTATDGRRGVETPEKKAQRNQTGVTLNDALQAPGGQLNPNWVEWLMGWPVGWTDLKPLGTDKFQEWLKQHGKF